MSVRRDTRVKESIPLEQLGERLPALLEQLQGDLFAAAKAFRDQQTVRVSSVEELEKHFADRRGFVVLPWRDDPALEARIKENTGATLRCLPLDSSALGIAGGESVAVFAKAY